MFEFLGKEVRVERKNGISTVGRLVEATPKYIMLMRDCEYYLIYDVSCVSEA